MGTIAEKLGWAGAAGLLGWAAGGAGFLVAVSLLPRLLARAPRILITALTSFGFWIALSSPSGATPRPTDHPTRPSDAPEAPWSPAEGPPPLPSVGDPGSSAQAVATRSLPHPAIHGGAGKVLGPLFPRLEDTGCSRKRELAECMGRHPAGRSLKPSSPEGPDARPKHAFRAEPAPYTDHSPSSLDIRHRGTHETSEESENDGRNHVDRERRGLQGGRSEPSPKLPRNYVVQRGDSLWGIAEDILGTENKAKVARYWPAIHRSNRETIGRDPDFLIPGQVLHLPDPTKV